MKKISDTQVSILIPFLLVYVYTLMIIYGIYYGIEYVCRKIGTYYYEEKNYLKVILSLAIGALALRFIWEGLNSLSIWICELLDIQFYTSAYIICFISLIALTVSFKVKDKREEEENENEY